MKNFVLVSLFVLLIGSTSYAAESSTTTLNKIENSLYGFTYNDENTLSRLERLEKSIYGQNQKGSESQRLAKLSKDISADEIGNEIEPVEDTFAEYPDYIAEEEMQERSDVSYPVIDEMEKQMFNQVYKSEKIKDRLTRLEQKVFKKTYNEDLNTRTERLKAELRPQSFMDNKVAQSTNIFYDDDLVEPADTKYYLDKYVSPNSFDYEAYNDRNRQAERFYDDYRSSQPKPVSMSQIEKKLYNHAYNNDSTEKRLARIESSMFGTEFSSDDSQTRLNRISSAYKAEKSAGKYDSNKFAQNMATAMQIGTILLMVLACIL